MTQEMLKKAEPTVEDVMAARWVGDGASLFGGCYLQEIWQWRH